MQTFLARTEDLTLLQKLVCEGLYGPGMAELEQQVAEHNILQREIEAYGQQLRTLVGPVGAPLSSLVCLPLLITISLDILAVKGELKRRHVGGGSAYTWGAITLNPASLFG